MNVHGTEYGDETPKKVIEILEESRQHKTRIRIIYGDPITGRVWDEDSQHDNTGYVGRMPAGNTNLPIMINNAHTVHIPAKGAILDTNIIEIRATAGDHVLYRKGINDQPSRKRT